MHLETTTFERAVHLALFIAGGIAFAIASLAVLERVGGGESRTIKLGYVVASAALFVTLAGAEMVYHVIR